MIFETFTLSKNSWHVKLMYYIWKWDYSDFSNICPYFWLSVINVVIFLPYSIYKLVHSVFTRIDKYYHAQIHRSILKEAEYFKNLMINHQDATFRDYSKLLSMLSGMTDSYNDSVIFNIGLLNDGCRIMYGTKNSNDHLIKYLNNTPFLCKFKEYIQEIEDKKRIQKSLKPTDLCKFYKPIGATILISISIFVLYYIIRWCANMITLVNWVIIKKILISILVMAMIIVGAIIITLLIGIAFDKIRFNFRISNSIDCRKWFEKYIDVPISCTIIGTKKFFQILYQLYKNNCPGIDWK